MKKSFWNHIKHVLSDRQVLAMMLGTLLLLVCFTYMYIDSGYMVEPLIRICYCLLFFVMVLTFGRRWIPYQLLVVAFSILYFNKWVNPTSFLLVCGFTYIKPRLRSPVLALYAVAVAVCLAIGHRTWAHGLAHLLFCTGIYFLLAAIRAGYSDARRLRMTEDESRILEQLAAGKMKKEVTGYSRNTVTEKIRNCMRRNGCTTEGELIYRFRNHAGPEFISEEKVP